jgi:hypothetical protein
VASKIQFNVGDLVENIPRRHFNNRYIAGKYTTFDGDLGIVVEVVDDRYLVVYWQKLKTNFTHFPHTLKKLSAIGSNIQ